MDSKAFIDKAMVEIAKEKVVLDVGGGRRFGKWMREYEPLFSGVDYRTLDFDEAAAPDVIGDIHAIPLPDAAVDAVICSSVLEHVRDPFRAMAEITRITRPGGKLFLYVPSIYPYHSHTARYPDYWRFFDDTVLELLAGYQDVRLCKQGGLFLALTFFVPFQHKMRRFLNSIAGMLDQLFRTHTRKTTAGYYAYATR